MLARISACSRYRACLYVSSRVHWFVYAYVHMCSLIIVCVIAYFYICCFEMYSASSISRWGYWIFLPTIQEVEEKSERKKIFTCIVFFVLCMTGFIHSLWDRVLLSFLRPLLSHLRLDIFGKAIRFFAVEI